MTIAPHTTVGVSGEMGRQRSLVARGEWEASWLAEQRAVSDVIRHRREGASDSQPGVSLGRERPEVDEAVDRLEVQTRTLMPHGPSATERANVELPVQAATRVRARHATVSPAQSSGVARPRELALHVDRSSRTESMRAAVPTPVRHSASWRHADGSIGIAMRVSDPDAAIEIVSQLRRWAREAGTSLRKLIVNGRAMFGSDQAKRAEPDASATPRSRLDTRI